MRKTKDIICCTRLTLNHLSFVPRLGSSLSLDQVTCHTLLRQATSLSHILSNLLHLRPAGPCETLSQYHTLFPEGNLLRDVLYLWWPKGSCSNSVIHTRGTAFNISALSGSLPGIYLSITYTLLKTVHGFQLIWSWDRLVPFKDTSYDWLHEPGAPPCNIQLRTSFMKL